MVGSGFLVCLFSVKTEVNKLIEQIDNKSFEGLKIQNLVFCFKVSR